MSLFVCDKNPEYTLVPNVFIKKHMLDVPAEYIQVYLMGLLYRNEFHDGSFSDFCSSLGMSDVNVIGAFEYWQQKGLVKIQNGKFLSFHYILDFELPKENLYTEQEFNITLQKLFGSRILTAADFNRIYDFTDIFLLSREVVLMLLEYCIKKKGKNVSFAYIEKVAKTWSEEGIDTVSEAVGKIKRFDAGSSDACLVLKHIGIMDRLPTEDEIFLYQKWTRDWGFSLDAIKIACSSTTKSRSPSMKYLDAILKGLYEKGMTTSSMISHALHENEIESDNIKKILLAMGMGSLAVSPEHIAFYRKWCGVFSFDIVLFAVKQSALYSKKSFAYVEKVLSGWQASGFHTLEEIEQSMRQKASVQRKMEHLFKLAGIQKSITDADRQKYIKWVNTYGFTEEVLSLACEISSVTVNPYKYLDKLLSIWYEKGIKTLSQATQEAKQTIVHTSERKNNAESLKYMHHNYTEDELSSLFVDLTHDVEE